MTMRTGPWGALCLAVLVLFVWVGAAVAAPTFPPLTGRVVDNANILSPQTEAELTNELATLEQQTGRQLVVATLPDLQGYEIEDYGYQLLRTWGIGDKDRDDGVILIVAPGERKVRIEVGYGLEPVLTDALSSLIISQRILPAFKEGRMEEGVVEGTRGIIQQLSLPEDEAKTRVAAAAQAKQPARDGGLGPGAILIIFVIFWLLSGVLGGRRRGAWWWLPLILSGGGGGGRWGGGGGGFGGGGFGGGGFSGGGGSGGGGGASGSW